MKTENMDKFAVSYKTAYQISPDDFAVVIPTLMVTKETTIGEILEWFNGGNARVDNMDVHIVQMVKYTS